MASKKQNPIRYLTSEEAAARLGYTHRAGLHQAVERGMLPPPDAVIGKWRGWLESTIDGAKRPAAA